MFKKLTALFLCLIMVFSLAACQGKTETESKSGVDSGEQAVEPKKEAIRLATTTSVNDSGLLGYLLPYFKEDTGYDVEVASAGTGIAIGYAKSGDADVLLVHSKAQEEDFIAEGFSSTERLSFMYNFFVICGPSDDPADIAEAENAAEAFRKIAAAGSAFVSRGDNSGTHDKEKNIWESAGTTPDKTAEWYVSVGSGMGDTLNKANELKAYVITDKATYLSMKQSLPNIQILKADADDMKNTYSLLGVNPDAAAFEGTGAAINSDGANAFIEWMHSDEAADLISDYGISAYGEQLFYVIEE